MRTITAIRCSFDENSKRRTIPSSCISAVWKPSPSAAASGDTGGIGMPIGTGMGDEGVSGPIPVSGAPAGRQAGSASFVATSPSADAVRACG